MPVDTSSALEKAFAFRSSEAVASDVTEVEEAIERRLKQGTTLIVDETRKQHQGEELLLYNESYLAWAERGAQNYVDLKTFPYSTASANQDKDLSELKRDPHVSRTCCIN